MNDIKRNSDTYTFFEVLRAINKRKKLILTASILAGIIAIAIGFALPKWYRAEAQIMPAYTPSISTSVSAVVGGIIGMGVDLGGGEGSFALPMMVTPTDLWADMASSYGIADSIIERFNLKELYGRRTIEDTRKSYFSHLFVKPTGAGILRIGYEARDPQLSAQITNAIVELIDRTLQRVRIVSAKRLREFVAERLAQCKSELTTAAQNLAEFQMKHKTVSIEDQAKVALENIAQLYAQLTIYDVQLKALKLAGIKYSPEIAQIQAQMDGIRQKIRQLESKGDDIFPGIQKYPDLYMKYMNLYREYQTQEIIYQYLKQQYEQARINEQRMIKTLHLISKATPPDKKVRPKKSIMGISAFFGVFIVLSLWTIWKDYMDKFRKIHSL